MKNRGKGKGKGKEARMRKGEALPTGMSPCHLRRNQLFPIFAMHFERSEAGHGPGRLRVRFASATGKGNGKGKEART